MSTGYWSWNENGSLSSLYGTYTQYSSRYSNGTVSNLVNGNFVLTASLTTPSSFSKWAGFIGGPKGAFWMGINAGKWCVGKQYGKSAEFAKFVNAPKNKKVTVKLIREGNNWNLYVDDTFMTSVQCRRSNCIQTEKITVGAGYNNGDEAWTGAVHSITILSLNDYKQTLQKQQNQNPQQQQNYWSWNENGSLSSLYGTYIKYNSTYPNGSVSTLVNRNFALIASVTTPSSWSKWTGFIGGPKGAFWMGLNSDKWCVGKQYGQSAEFARFVTAQKNKKVTITVIREGNQWSFYRNNTFMTSVQCQRSSCIHTDQVTIGAGYNNGDEAWKGAVHSITICSLQDYKKQQQQQQQQQQQKQQKPPPRYQNEGIDEKKQMEQSQEQQQQHYDSTVVNQLVTFGVGSRSEIIDASQKVVNYHDVNAVKDKVEEMNDDTMNAFVSQLDQLINVIRSHLKFMKQQEENVNKLIASSTSSELLMDAKKKALEREQQLLQQIMNISEINNFLNNIILIENLFNSKYSMDEKLSQQNARKKFASNIEIYEKKSKPISEIKSFIDLLFAAKTHIGSFKALINEVNEKCKQQNVKIISNTGAKEKNIERSFYKSFYVYSELHPKDGFKQMTDTLRCSIVFDNFENLYQCFNIIEQLSKQNNNGGILRCKDRFNPQKMPFGYRDLLINIYCPGSKIVCEIQLQHNLFYKYKKISHEMYKKARLFEKGYANLAYDYADKFTRNTIGDKIYKFDDDEEDESKNESYKLMEQWGLTKYAKQLIDDDGYDDPGMWIDITEEELTKDMGFKKGHAKKFIKMVKNM